MEIAETPAEQLYRKLRLTSSARFDMSRRLLLHRSLSLWTISLFSVILVVVPLLAPLGITLRHRSASLDVIVVLAACVILVASILVNASKFGERAVKMHRCGLEISILERQLYAHIAAGESADVDQIRSDYDNILQRYENHSDVDYRFARIKRAPEYYQITFWDRFVARLSALVEFSPYLVLIGLEIGVFYWIVTTALA